MMFLDIAKAFNCISHDILFAKMYQPGFSDNVIRWFKSYLNRFQKVTTGSNGIAHGTVLGPIMFIFYINGILKSTNYVKMSLFADDCVCYLSGNNWVYIQVKMQEDFNAIIDYGIIYA